MSRNKRPSTATQKKTPKLVLTPPDVASDDRGLKIGEAARLIGVETYVLRFWETQFPILKPRHARSRHRFYQPRDIEVLRTIKRLLHQEGFTIAGANKYIRENGLAEASSSDATEKAPPARAPRESSSPRNENMRDTLAKVRYELESLHKMLGD
ncbi:MAG TPA: MerR family transcriptional regulator [Candidatus Binataceae bacterium]|nr:MerR family transcriptional regulator [Candidatus Binataceae bacterium]